MPGRRVARSGECRALQLTSAWRAASAKRARASSTRICDANNSRSRVAVHSGHQAHRSVRSWATGTGRPSSRRSPGPAAHRTASATRMPRSVPLADCSSRRARFSAYLGLRDLRAGRTRALTSARAPHRRCARRAATLSRSSATSASLRTTSRYRRPTWAATSSRRTRASMSATSSWLAARSRRRSRLPPSSTTLAEPRRGFETVYAAQFARAGESSRTPHATRYCGPNESASPRAPSAARAASVAFSCALLSNASSTARNSVSGA